MVVHRKKRVHIQKSPNERTHTIYSEALAGTVVRGSNIKEDIELEKVTSFKKRRRRTSNRHRWYSECPSKYCSSVLYEQQPSIKKQNFVQHLCTKITAEYKEISHTTSLQDLICTSSNSGCMDILRKSLKRLYRIEGFDRGLYAGAFGIILMKSPSVWEFALHFIIAITIGFGEVQVWLNRQNQMTI